MWKFCAALVALIIAAGCLPKEDTSPDPTDNDGDGYDEAAGDCDDEVAAVNPGGFDFPGNSIDEDCSGTADDSVVECDDTLGLASTLGTDAAAGLGLCQDSNGVAWGLKSASWMDGNLVASGAADFPLGHGLLDELGNIVPRQGLTQTALSTGTARDPGDAGYQAPGPGYDKGYVTGTPASYSQPDVCSGSTALGTPADSIVLELVLQTPTNATGFSFDYFLLTAGFPTSICTAFNDLFVVLVDPVPAEAVAGNVAIDSAGVPVGVSTELFQACSPQSAGGETWGCMQGTTALTATGFDTAGGTGWLTTTVPIATPGEEVTLRFAIWDTGDSALDSTVVLDNFTWLAGSVNAGTAVAN